MMPPEAKIVDIGCGGGIKSHYLKERGFDVTGIDISEEMIHLAKETYPNITFLVGDMRSLPFENQSFDAVFCQAALLHIPKHNILNVLQELTRIIKPQGTMWVSVKEVREGKPDQEIKKENDYGYEYERFFSYFTRQELREYFSLLNLEVIDERTEPSGKTIWLSITGRKS